MNLQQKISLIGEVGEEIIGEGELKDILSLEEPQVAYDGFEPSGQMHIGQGILRAINVNKMIKAGVRVKMLVADWHAMANNKLGGDLEKIQSTGKYFIEVWKACGMNVDGVDFVWASDLVKSSDYWKLVLQIARTNSLRRFVRTAEIMGRDESLDLTAAQILYPCMQVADIFVLNARIAQLGMDQRKVNMLAREIGEILGYWKPVVVSHHMLMGLGNPVTNTHDKVARTIELKMSKSKPDTSIFMTDTSKEITRKIQKAWCPEGDIHDNPILEYCKYIIFESYDEVCVERSEKHGGKLVFHTYDDLEEAFSSRELHPMDLKQAVACYIDRLVQPVRDHFVHDAQARDILAQVQSFHITR